MAKEKLIKRIKIIIIFSVVISSYIVYIAIDHNPQNEFIDGNGTPIFFEIFSLFLGWFSVSCVFFLIMILCIDLIKKYLKKLF